HWDFICVLMKGSAFDELPFFNGEIFICWNARMKIYLKHISIPLWLILLNGYSSKPKRVLNNLDKKSFSLNIRAMHILRYSLNDDAYARIKYCDCAKDIWDSLNAYNMSNNVFEHQSTNIELEM
ncbi:MAG: hypothetical protein Q8877_02900, partial [Sweet potato little leaf phytoplasma]|nr:hypothetical protein [Sweet potato little leaf phytoplasma]